MRKILFFNLGLQTGEHVTRAWPLGAIRATILSFGLIAFAVLLTQRAEAKIVTIMITGTVTSGTDTVYVNSVQTATGLGGANFSLVYTADDSKGTSTLTNVSGDYGSSIVSTSESNPITAVLTINGKSYPYGIYLPAQITSSIYRGFTLSSGVCSYSGACSDSYGYSETYNLGGYSGTGEVQMEIISGKKPFTLNPSWEAPLSYNLVSAGASTSNANFIWGRFIGNNGSFGNNGEYLYGTLNATNVTIIDGSSSAYARPADFNGDGKSDFLWRDNTAGIVDTWLINGGNIIGSGPNQAVSSDWSIVGTGDFNGDGKSDILWRNTNGAVFIWEMNGGAILGGVGGQVVTIDWQIAGTGDFNGDGTSDILWRNTDGTVLIWEMNDGTPIAAVGGQVVTTDWQIAGVGDFNGDGKSDIIWRNATTGEVLIWEMNGGTPIISAGGQIAGPDWQIAGTGDFNGDGLSDILWRNRVTGQVLIWEMSGGTLLASVGNQVVTTDWQIIGSGDFNGDGYSDILWRNLVTGQVLIWEMDGGTILANVGGQGLSLSQWSMAQ